MRGKITVKRHTTSKANLTALICSDKKACLWGRNWKRLGVTPRGNTQMVNFFQLFRTRPWQAAFSVSAQFPKWRKPKANSSLFCVILYFLLNGITPRTYCLFLSSIACFVPSYFSFSIFYLCVLCFSLLTSSYLPCLEQTWPRSLNQNDLSSSWRQVQECSTGSLSVLHE